MEQNGTTLDSLGGPQIFLLFGQLGFEVKTKPKAKKIDDRASSAQYPRCIGKDLYQIYLNRTKKNPLLEPNNS